MARSKCMEAMSISLSFAIKQLLPGVRDAMLNDIGTIPVDTFFKRVYNILNKYNTTKEESI